MIQGEGQGKMISQSAASMPPATATWEYANIYGDVSFVGVTLNCYDTYFPSEVPTEQPSEQPSRQPSEQPSEKPSGQPSEQPTEQPSEQPTEEPSEQPTQQPSEQPSQQPTATPTQQPSNKPSEQPTRQPSQQPSEQPTKQPTEQPSEQPTEQPSQQPSEDPTAFPTASPTELCIALEVIGSNFAGKYHLDDLLVENRRVWSAVDSDSMLFYPYFELIKYTIKQSLSSNHNNVIHTGFTTE